MGWSLAAENRSLVMKVGSTPTNPFTAGSQRASATAKRLSESANRLVPAAELWFPTANVNFRKENQDEHEHGISFTAIPQEFRKNGWKFDENLPHGRS
jgi:hypothetical protein